ncbi:3-deoxy-7-phosphoheptulonate synthase [Rhodanobacter sp. ANJX3]|uniref:3-deoxy-7-phosphoheptulonate synthase n=1 Tax=Rhodanobacter sp. ANJX3 TaxID=2723083 RepID=UPI0021083877|nr:3-deoxy-7-phosphoheptulonate synthase [Rhodanobacter sp. ANJX3]
MNSHESQEHDRWLPHGWRDKEPKHMPSYPQEENLAKVVTSLSRLPGLVDVAEVHALKVELRAAAEGRVFALQLGNAEECFEDVSSGLVREQVKNLESVHKYLTIMLDMPVLPIGVLAGNYARSCVHPTEVIDGITMTSYYGDMVNEVSPDPRGRSPNANRMLMAYEASLHALRAIRHGKFKPYISHEGANLHFEEALVRRGSISDGFYASSAHLLWLESINLFSGSSYLEFLRGVLNPIGIRVGPQLSAAQLLDIYMQLNPTREPGKIVLVTSLGRQLSGLRHLIQVLREAAAPAVWMCDPWWVNSVDRHDATCPLIDDVIAEVEHTALLHADEGSVLAGLRLEIEHATQIQHGKSVASRASRLDFLQVLHVCSDLARAYRGIQ